MYQNVTEGDFVLFDKKNFQLPQSFYVEHCLYPSITDFSQAMKSLIQERHNDSKSCIFLKVSGETQKVEIYLANEGSDLAFFSTDLGQFFGGNVDNHLRVTLRG